MTPFQMIYAMIIVLYTVAVVAIVWILIVGITLLPIFLIVLLFRRLKTWNDQKCNTERST